MKKVINVSFVLLALSLICYNFVIDKNASRNISLFNIAMAQNSSGEYGSGGGWKLTQDFIQETAYCYGHCHHILGSTYCRLCSSCLYDIAICPLGEVNDCSDDGGRHLISENGCNGNPELMR
jgi:hypothetical protein